MPHLRSCGLPKSNRRHRRKWAKLALKKFFLIGVMELYIWRDFKFVKMCFWETLVAVGYLRDYSQKQEEDQMRLSPSPPVWTRAVYGLYFTFSCAKTFFGWNMREVTVFIQTYFVTSEETKSQREKLLVQSHISYNLSLLTRPYFLSTGA